ncbi:UvrD-helicase domain-containing protein [Streptomyces sp. NPDC055078]
MISAYAGSPALTVEQRRVVEQPWDARVLVTAAAGSGKTHTLVRRLDALMDDGDQTLEAGEILVLSFSRAAVRELRDRIADHADNARRVRVQTFDSWAYALLTSTYPDEQWSHRTFEQRIEEATEAVIRGGVESSEMGTPAHVVIDEVQDLVGVRRDMVETLLDHFQDSCGFTVVGDSAQAIFGFQVSAPDARATETNYFFDWLRASYADDLVELHLSTNFRASTREARTALPFGPGLQQLSSDPADSVTEGERTHRELRARLLECPDFGGLDDAFTLDSLRSFPGTCAILCRDNSQTLALSESLFGHGVRHRVHRSLLDRPVPPWVADLLRRTGSTTLNVDRFREILSEAVVPRSVDANRVWRSLRGAARGPRGLLDVSSLRRLIAEGRFPDDLTESEPESLVVSTIHRAKGLEFDRVIVVEPPTTAELRRQHSHVDPAAEARALYVAMTRPRDDLFRISPPRTTHIRLDRAIGRWYVGGWQSHVRLGIEATGRDFSREHPPGTDGFESNPTTVQEYLTSSVHPGDELSLRLQHDMQMAADQSPPYTVLHNGTPIGVVSEVFRRALHGSLKINKSWEIDWPVEVAGFRMDTLECVAGSRASASRAGLGEQGVWVVPRLSGLGRHTWRGNPGKGLSG